MTTNDLFKTANEFAKKHQLTYTGALTPSQTYQLLQSDSTIKLIDVRTQAERDWVGTVAIPDEQHFAIEWTLYPSREQNQNFLVQLSTLVSMNTKLVFLCRSGLRSHHAATSASNNGFTHCFNILEGFEGDKDPFGHRKTLNGWCSAGLPWVGA